MKKTLILLSYENLPLAAVVVSNNDKKICKESFKLLNDNGGIEVSAPTASKISKQKYVEFVADNKFGIYSMNFMQILVK